MTSNEPWAKWLSRHPDAKCMRCGTGLVAKRNEENSPSEDHIVPRMWGGPDIKENRQTLCLKCHREKGADERWALIAVFKHQLSVDDATAWLLERWDFRGKQ